MDENRLEGTARNLGGKFFGPDPSDELRKLQRLQHLVFLA
jgi:hypothetical protein